MAKRLIVNADGFGFTFGNNRAILEVLDRGFIRSVSVNVTWPAVTEVPRLLREFPHVTVGVHLNLSVGPSILPPREIPSLIGDGGEFEDPRFCRLALRRKLNVEEMKAELRAQVRRLREFGVRITHWDSHKGRHLYPGFFEAALAVTRQEGIPASRSHVYRLVVPPRWRLLRVARFYLRHPRQVLTHARSAYLMGVLRKAGVLLPDRRLVIAALGPGAACRPDAWRLLLQTVPEGLNIIECHPGYVDDDLRRYSRLTDSRQKELELFRDAAWTARAAAAGVELVSYEPLLEQGSR